MSAGREVADAYIDVHGDTSKFRKSLDKAAAAGRKEGGAAADSFMEGWEKRAKNQWGRKYDSVLDATFSKKKVDWDRMLGQFDAKGFDDAKTKIEDFMRQARAEGNMTKGTYKNLSKAFRETRTLMEANHKQTLKEAEIQRKLREKQLSDQQAHQWELAKSRAAQERYNESFTGLFRANNLKSIEKDFRGIVNAMSETDWSKFTKGEEDLDKVTKRVREVIGEMNNLGRVTDTEGKRIIDSINRHVMGERLRRDTILAVEAATERAKIAQDKYNKSLDGMMDAAKIKTLENAYKKFASALANQDWGPVTKDFGNMRTFTNHVRETSQELLKTGKIGEDEFRRINAGVREASNNTKEWGVRFSTARRHMGLMDKAVNSMKQSWQRMDGTVKLVLSAIAFAAGPVATALSGAAAGATALVSSLGLALASAVPLAAATVALGVGVALAVKSMDSMKASFPLIQQSIDRMSATWTAQAEAFGAAWGASLGNLLDSFATQLAAYDFGTPLGEAFTVITNAFNDVVNGPAFAAFMGAMTTDLPAAAAGLGSGLAGVFSMLMSLMAGAAPAAKALGEDFAGWGAKIAASMEKARETGKLNEVFQLARESLLAVLDLAGSVGAALGTMFGLGAASGNRMLAALTGVVDQFNSWMQTEAGRAAMLEWFQNGERILAALAPLAVGLGVALGGLVTPESIAQFENLMTNLGAALPLLGNLLETASAMGVLNILAEALLAVTAGLQPLLEPLRQMGLLLGPMLQQSIIALTPLLTSITMAMAPVIESMTRIWAEVGPQVVAAFQRITEALSPVIAVIGQVVEVIVSVLAPIFTGLLIQTIDAVVNVINGLSNVFMGVWAVIQNVVGLIVAIFTGDFAAIGPLLQGIWDGIVQIFLGALEAAWGLINLYLVGKMFSAIKSVMALIKGIFTTSWTAIRTFLTSSMTNINSVAQKAMTSMLNVIKSILTNIRSFFSTIWNGIRTGVSTAVNGIRTNISNVMTAILRTVTDILNGVRMFFSSIWAGISNTVGAAIRGIQHVISSVLGAIRGTVSSILNGISSIISGVWNAARNLTSSAWHGISNAVSSGANSVMSWVLTLPGRIVNSLSSLVSSLTSVGRNMMQGLINGVISMATGIFNAAINAVKGAVDGVKNFLGINSPSRLFMGMGEFMGEGMAIGLDHSARQVADAAHAMAEATTAEFSSSKMYTAGKDAASGLARGLKDNKSTVTAAFSSLQAGVKNIGTDFSASAGRPARDGADSGGKTVIIEDGAVRIETKTTDPKMSADMLLDGLVNQRAL